MLKSEVSGMRRIHVIIGTLASLLLLTVFTQLSIGQGAPEYYSVKFNASLMTVDATTGEPKLDDKQIRALSQMKGQVLLGSIPYADKQADFEKYYKGYVFPMFSQVDSLNKLPDNRKLILDDLRRARSKEVRDVLLNLTKLYMKGFVQKTDLNFHPAVRFNALLMIGELNLDEASVANQQRFPNPLPEGLTILIEEFKKPNQTDAMRLAATIGMLRHAQLDWARPEANRIPPAQRQEIRDLMLALVNQKDAPQGRPQDGHVWLQRRALDVLGALGVVGPVDTVNTSLASLVRNPDAAAALRCTAAATMYRLNATKSKPKLNPADEALNMGAMLVQVCRADLTRINDHSKRLNAGFDPASGGMMPGMPGGGMMPGMPGGGMMPGMPGGGMMPGMPGGGMMPGMPGGGMMPGGMGEGGAPGLGMGDGFGDGFAEGDGGGVSTGVFGPKDPLVDMWRRKLKYEILCVQLGLKGLTPLAPADPQKSTLKSLNDEVTKVMKATDPAPHLASLTGLHKSVDESLKELEKLTAAVMPKPKVVDPPAAALTSDTPEDVPAAAATPKADPSKADPSKSNAGPPADAPANGKNAGTPPAGPANPPTVPDAGKGAPPPN